LKLFAFFDVWIFWFAWYRDFTSRFLFFASAFLNPRIYVNNTHANISDENGSSNMITSSAAQIYVQASVPCLPLLRIPSPFCRLRSKSSFILLRGFKPRRVSSWALRGFAASSHARRLFTRLLNGPRSRNAKVLNRFGRKYAESSSLFIDPTVSRHIRYQWHANWNILRALCGIANSILIATKKKINLFHFQNIFYFKFEDVLHEYYFNVKNLGISKY